jgi:hypothetical protein
MSLPLQAQVQAKLAEPYRLLLETLRNHAGLDNRSYKLFAPRTGRLYDRELMLVGRALYGWATAELNKDSLSKDGVNQAVEDSWKYLDQGGCPLAALIDEWERLRAIGASKYNERRSQFWMTAREVMEGLQLAAPERSSWASRMHWTNLYKVNPAETGNPGGRLRRAQEKICQEILQEEIALLRPKRILFLTGLDWAESFLTSFGARARVDKLEEDPWVQARGSLPIGAEKARFVVAVHPARKPRRLITASVLEHFEALESSAALTSTSQRIVKFAGVAG